MVLGGGAGVAVGGGYSEAAVRGNDEDGVAAWRGARGARGSRWRGGG